MAEYGVLNRGHRDRHFCGFGWTRGDSIASYAAAPYFALLPWNAQKNSWLSNTRVNVAKSAYLTGHTVDGLFGAFTTLFYLKTIELLHHFMEVCVVCDKNRQSMWYFRLSITITPTTWITNSRFVEMWTSGTCLWCTFTHVSQHLAIFEKCCCFGCFIF